MINHETIQIQRLQHHNYKTLTITISYHWLVPRNFRNFALTDLITSRSNCPQSPIQHIITQQPNIDDTYQHIIEQPDPLILLLRTTIFLTHDELSSWIPPSINFPTGTPSEQPSHHPTFCFPHLNHLIRILHPSWNHILIPTQHYITLSPKSTLQYRNTR